MAITYTIDENNAVSIFNSATPNDEGAPDIFQPWHPATPHEAWTKEEATAWAEETVANLNNPPKPVEPVTPAE